MPQLNSCLPLGFLALLAATAGCERLGEHVELPPSNQLLVLTGSSTIAPLAVEIGKRFEAQDPSVRVDVQTGGSSRGIRDAHTGSADIGMASRELKPKERDGVVTKTIAWDGVAFAVHRDNPVEVLSREHLIGVYTGKITNWRKVGGADAPIIVSNRAEGRSELDLVTDYLGVGAPEIKAGVIDGETQQTIKTVTTNKNAIVYTSVGAAQHAADNGAPLKLLPLEGVEASTESVRSGEFPLARPLLLILPTAPGNASAQEFVRYALTADIDDLIEGFGYVPPKRDAS